MIPDEKYLEAIARGLTAIHPSHGAWAAGEIIRLRALVREIATSTDAEWGRRLARREVGIEDKPSQVERALQGELGTH